MVRRSIAGGAALVALVLFLLLFRGCLDSRKEQSFRDYSREVAELTSESDDQSANVFRLLTEPGDAGDVEIETQLNAFAASADQLLDRARDTERPDELADTHEYLVDTLEFRRDGVRQVARLLPGAITSQEARREGTDQIAAAMQNFLASDVIFNTRVKPRLEAALKEQELDGEVTVQRSVYLPDPGWLDPATVADRVTALGGSGGGGDEDAAPGLHGNGLGTVTLGGVTLVPDDSASVPLSGDLTFEVQILNQGENTETDVEVNVTVGSGGDATDLSEVLPEIAAGETATVEVPFDAEPPTGQNVPITVEVAAVPGEEVTDNNAGEFSAIFTR
jgi:hypothetical protein